MNTARPMETKRDQMNLADERRAVEAEQQGAVGPPRAQRRVQRRQLREQPRSTSR